MISFRYHLVSLIAAFLALAVGVVVGATALNGPVTADLRSQVRALKGDRTDLSAQVKTVQGRLATAEQFATTFGSRLVADTLKDDKVLVLSLPGASTGMADAIASQLTAAGATITGRLQLAPAFVDPAQADSIGTLAVGPAHPLGLTLPTTSDPRVLGAAMLSYVLVGKGQNTDLSTVLGGFSGLHMIESSPDGIEPARDLVVVGNGSLPGNPYAGEAQYDLVSQLVAAGASVVVAGDSAAATGNGIVSEVRGNSLKSNVSTVDDADTAFGQVSTPLALAATTGSQVGQYGTGRGAEALFPTVGK